MPARSRRDALVQFLNSIPRDLDPNRWVMAFLDALRAYLDGVDHAAFLFNVLGHEHRDTELNEANVQLHEDAGSSLGFGTRSLPPFLSERIDLTWRIEIESLGKSVDEYHPPVSFSFGDSGWIASIILFRELSNPPIDDNVVAMVEEIRPFLVFLVEDHNLRYQATHPADRFFFDAMLGIVRGCGLTQQEMRVMQYRLLGRSYKEIGDLLRVAPSTVKNHLSAIHRKAGVHNQTELFARYFAPRFGLLTTPGSQEEGADSRE